MKVKVLSNFAIGQTHLGKSVFSARPFIKGDVVTQFTGPILHKLELPSDYRGEDDRFVQIGAHVFMGPSNDIDDLINHSCEPNAGLKFDGTQVLLIAIQDIAEGEEITWDYSTTMFENEWKMRCDCRKESCRKIISDFMLLSPDLQNKYKELGVIPQYLTDYMGSAEYEVYTVGIKQLQEHVTEKE